MKPPQTWGCVPHEPKRGVIDWNTKLVLNWQVDPDGYRIEPRKGRHKLYVVADGGEPRRYTAYAWEEDNSSSNSQTLPPRPFPGASGRRSVRRTHWSIPSAPLLTKFSPHRTAWSSNASSRSQSSGACWTNPTSNNLSRTSCGQAVQVRECFKLKEDGQLIIDCDGQSPCQFHNSISREGPICWPPHRPSATSIALNSWNTLVPLEATTAARTPNAANMARARRRCTRRWVDDRASIATKLVKRCTPG